MKRFIDLPSIVIQAIESRNFYLGLCKNYILIEVEDDDKLLEDYFSNYFHKFTVNIYGNRYDIVYVQEIAYRGNRISIKFSYTKPY